MLVDYQRKTVELDAAQVGKWRTPRATDYRVSVRMFAMDLCEVYGEEKWTIVDAGGAVLAVVDGPARKK